MTYDEIIEQLEITKSKIKEIARNEYGGESWNDDLDVLTEAADIVADYSKATAQASEMYKLFKCRDMQPQNHLYDKNNSCEPFLINNKDEYILIGCSEIKKHIDYHQTSLIFAYQGIVGEAGDEHQIPLENALFWGKCFARL